MKIISAKIENFKSLENCTLNFRDLNIIVGPNSSGKSNCLESLYFLSFLVKNGSPPQDPKLLAHFLKIDTEKLMYEINLLDEDEEPEASANYQVALSIVDGQPSFIREKLSINELTIIDLENNQGKIYDENGKNQIDYLSEAGNLALKSAGDFGDKPITRKIAKFMRNWKFYNLDPDIMRPEVLEELGILVVNNPPVGVRGSKKSKNYIPTLGSSGDNLAEVIVYWYHNLQSKFYRLNQELKDCLGITLEVSTQAGENTIKAIEPNGAKVPFSSMSDGTLRIIAYYLLLDQENLPPLIGIEEPERNLHPGILNQITSVFKKLSRKTQLIITTHSSQLLDCFSPTEINDNVAIILLDKDAHGTIAYQLDELEKNREDLSEWMANFGVGNAIYYSQLLQDILKK